MSYQYKREHIEKLFACYPDCYGDVNRRVDYHERILQYCRRQPRTASKIAEHLGLLLRIGKRKVTYMLEQGFIPYEETGLKSRGQRTQRYFIRLKDVEEHPEQLTALGIAYETEYAEHTVERWFKEGRLKTVWLLGEMISCKQ